MGLASTLATGLLAARIQSDLEFKLGALSERRLAVLDKSKQVGEQYSNSLFTPGDQDDKHFEQQLIKLQVLDKTIDTQMRQMETQLKINTEMKESLLKASKEDAKKSFTISA